MDYVYYVSTKGSDDSSGTTHESSFATLKRAFAALKDADKSSGSALICVEAGLYSDEEGLCVEREAFGSEQFKIRVVPHGGEVRLTGARQLKCLGRDGDRLIYDAEGLDVKELYLNGRRMIKARYPKFDSANPYGGGWLFVPGRQVNIYQPGAGDENGFLSPTDRPARWAHIDEVELFIFPRFNWQSDIVPLKGYDAKTGRVTLARPCAQMIYPTDRFYFQNVKEELSDPGEWYFDRREGKVYLIPFADMDGEALTVLTPVADNVIRLEGEPLPESFRDGTFDGLDGEASPAVSMRWNQEPEGYISFEHLTLEGCRRDGFLNKRGHGVALIGCTVRNTGGWGVRSLRGRHNRISGCDIYDTGTGGVYLSGGYRDSFGGFYREADNVLDNCYIHHVGRVNRAVTAVEGYGVGIRISHNLIHDCSRTGIRIRGNKNYVEYNEIRHVNIETSDAAAINMCDRNLSNHDNFIRYNKIHDILGLHLVKGKWEPQFFTFGIYLDDFTSGVDITGNLIYRTPRGGIFIHGNQDVRVTNNVCLEARKDMLFLRRWGKGLEYERLGTHGMSMTRNTYKHNIVASHEKDCAVYAVENCMNEDWQIDMRDNEFDENLFCTYGQEPRLWVCQDLGYDVYDRWFEPFSTWQKLGHDTHSVFADPLFVDPEHDDYRLKEDSPALKLGFQPLPIDEMGPYESNERATWPIVEAPGARETPVVIDYFKEGD
ncbi:MAG: right-handed parallel beta-helix repeat-containing protein [Clostridia bacterium]|nr:right-handed parallel beta-helix repeat-containing protein [Clostridia bacterium]